MCRVYLFVCQAANLKYKVISKAWWEICAERLKVDLRSEKLAYISVIEFFFSPIFSPKSCIFRVQMQQHTGVSSVSWRPFVHPGSKRLVISLLFCPEEHQSVPDRPCFTPPPGCIISRSQLWHLKRRLPPSGKRTTLTSNNTTLHRRCCLLSQVSRWPPCYLELTCTSSAKSTNQ